MPTRHPDYFSYSSPVLEDIEVCVGVRLRVNHPPPPTVRPLLRSRPYPITAEQFNAPRQELGPAAERKRYLAIAALRKSLSAQPGDNDAR